MNAVDRKKYDSIRKELDLFGYPFHFPADSLLLVERLVADLGVERNKLQLVQDKLFENNQYPGVGVERYRQDNTTLLNNLDLCKKIDVLVESHGNEIKLLRDQLENVREEIEGLGLFHKQSIKKVQALQSELVEKDTKILELSSQNCAVTLKGKKKKISSPVLQSLEALPNENVYRKEIDTRETDLNLMKIMETRAGNLSKEVKILRDDNCKLSDLVVELKKQIRARDTEIIKLKNALQCNRPPAGIPDPCCCSCQQKDSLIESLEHQCKDAINKQHEAMSRALQLAERNENLERELKDLANMATSLEETYKRDSRQKEMELMQQRLDVAQRDLKDVETRLKDTKEKLENETKNVESLKRSKKNAEQDFASEKKSLTEKINKLVVVEQELKQDVERLQAANQTLRRRWNEQNCTDSRSCPCKCPRSPPWKSKRLIDKTEPKICGCAPTLLLLDKIQKERDYFHNLIQERLPSRLGQEEESLKLLLDRAQRERDNALADLRRAQDERDSYKNRMPGHSHYLNDSSRFPSNPADNRSNFALEKQCEDYRLQLRTCQAELSQVNSLYAQLKSFCEQTDRSLTGSQTRLTQIEGELIHAQGRIRDLEKVKWELEERLSVGSREKAATGQNLAHCVREKDELVAALDEKTEKLARMENEVLKRDRQVAEATDQITQAQKKFELTLSEKTTRDHAYRTLELTLERVRHDLSESLAVIEKLKVDNRNLQEQLSAALRDGHDAHKDVDMARQEVSNLKRQLQQYVTEVERAEDLISKKEKQQEDMLANFHTLSLEATSLENSNHNLESEVEVSKMTVQELTRQVHELETQLANRNELVTAYEKQIDSLSHHIAELEAKLEAKALECARLEKDLSALNELCGALDKQQENQRSRSFSVENEKSTLSRELRRLSQENNGLSDALQRERSEVDVLRESLTNSRQETLKHQSSNKNLTTLVHELKKKVDELNNRLESEMKSVHRYEDECRILNTEVKELRRDMTNRLYETATSSASRDLDGNLTLPRPQDQLWKLPLLPMPRSSDISPVSSDMYFSPVEGDSDYYLPAHFHDLSAGTYRMMSDEPMNSPNCRPLSTIEENTSSGDISCPWAQCSKPKW